MKTPICPAAFTLFLSNAAASQIEVNSDLLAANTSGRPSSMTIDGKNYDHVGGNTYKQRTN